MPKRTILVIEDEKDIADLVAFTFRQAGYRVMTAGDGEEGLRLARIEHPDLVVLDLMLPGIGGKDVCRRLKQAGSTNAIPVIMLTALADETDRIVGFELGADDYVTKPFSPREMVLRAQAVLRRNEPEEAAREAQVRVAGLAIDPERHEVTADGEPVNLTATEYKLLHHLASRADKVHSREALLRNVWGYAYDGYARTVDTHIRRLRKKLGKSASRIETIRGFGYRFKSDA